MIYPTEFVNYQEKLYWLYKKIHQNHIKDDGIEVLKTAWNCEIVLKQKNQTDDYLLFLREIPELELANDLLN